MTSIAFHLLRRPSKNELRSMSAIVCLVLFLIGIVVIKTWGTAEMPFAVAEERIEYAPNPSAPALEYSVVIKPMDTGEVVIKFRLVSRSTGVVYVLPDSQLTLESERRYKWSFFVPPTMTADDLCLIQQVVSHPFGSLVARALPERTICVERVK